MTKPLILVDGSAYLYRSFHAMPNLTNSMGEPTGAILGVINMLKRLMVDWQPERLLVVFDASGPTFRDHWFAEYKSNRPPTPDALKQQFEPLCTIIRALGVPILIQPGVEADDVLGTLACQEAAQGGEVLLVTGDKDFAQLVDERIHLLDTMKDIRLDRDGVWQKFGVWPEQIVDYLALMGDSVDNIPGVPKCGPKTAAGWLQTYGSAAALAAAADGIGGKIGENLRAFLPQLELSQRLAKIYCDLELPLGVNQLQLQPADIEALRGHYQQQGFRTLLKTLPSPQELSASVESEPQLQLQLDGADAEPPPAETSVLTPEQLRAFESGPLALVRAGDRLALAIATQSGYLDAASAAAFLRRRLQGPDLLVLFDAKSWLLEWPEVSAPWQDVQLMSYLLDSGQGWKHELVSLAGRHLGREPESGVAEAQALWQLHQQFLARFEPLPRLKALWLELEQPLVPVLVAMQQVGMAIDAELLQQQSAELAIRLQQLEQQAAELAGSTFNLNSPKQLQQIFFEQLKLPVIKKTPKGQPSTDEEVLQTLAADYPLPALILEYRSLAKLKSTYTDPLPLQRRPPENRVHSSLHQTVAATGRLSSTEPNLQNIPIRTPEGRRIRQAFVAAPGFKLMSADYSQIELRIMAHLCADPGLLRAFQQGEDIHQATAAEVFGVALADVSADQRRSAKAINFGLIYGMSAFGLAKQLGIDQKQAQSYIDAYFARYPGIAAYMEQTRLQAAEQGYIETWFGRRLYLPEINSGQAIRRKATERAAINAPMQGTAADIIKRAMLAVSTFLQQAGLKSRLVLQVHDELLLEVAEAELEQVEAGVLRCMIDAAELKVPLLVGCGIGDNWQQAH